jgi:hypothetical protein
MPPSQLATKLELKVGQIAAVVGRQGIYWYWIQHWKASICLIIWMDNTIVCTFWYITNRSWLPCSRAFLKHSMLKACRG